MEYNKLVSVSGLPGLFELIASKSDGAILRSLDDKTTRFVSSRVHNFSHLESIEVYTEQENVNLAEVFQAMQGSGETLPNEKDAPAVKKYFEKVYPAMDFDRVYASDMKKMIKWFDVLQKNNVEIKLSEEPLEEEEEVDKPAQQIEEVVAEPENAKVAQAEEVEIKSAEPGKVKAARAKKTESGEAKEEASAETETKAPKKKSTKK